MLVILSFKTSLYCNTSEVASYILAIEWTTFPTAKFRKIIE